MQGWSKSTTYVSVGMMAAGFLLIVLAWNGASNLAYVDGQIPFLISGGVGGLGLVMAGLTIAIVQEMRRNTMALVSKLDEVIEAGKDAEALTVEFDESTLTPRAAAARRQAIGEPSKN